MGCEYYYVVTESPPHSLPGGAVPGNAAWGAPPLPPPAPWDCGWPEKGECEVTIGRATQDLHAGLWLADMGHVTECDDTIGHDISDTWSWSLVTLT